MGLSRRQRAWIHENKTKVNPKQCHHGKQNKVKTGEAEGVDALNSKRETRKNKCKTVRHDSLLDEKKQIQKAF